MDKRKEGRVVYRRRCLRCGVSFETTREAKVYCCFYCQDRARRKRRKQRLRLRRK